MSTLVRLIIPVNTWPGVFRDRYTGETVTMVTVFYDFTVLSVSLLRPRSCYLRRRDRRPLWRTVFCVKFLTMPYNKSNQQNIFLDHTPVGNTKTVYWRDPHQDYFSESSVSQVKGERILGIKIHPYTGGSFFDVKSRRERRFTPVHWMKSIYPTPVWRPEGFLDRFMRKREWGPI